MRRIGALMNLAADDPESQDRVGAFLQQLAKLGWTIGHNLQIDYLWAAGDDALTRRYAAELVALAPDVILAAPRAQQTLAKGAVACDGGVSSLR